jgi:predicted glycosyl hydrolase (DUF1957 family)
MAKMYVAFVLNLYQPLNQPTQVVEEITRECYLPLAELFTCELNPKFTVSITGSLLRLLQNRGKDELLGLLKQAKRDNKVDIVHSGAYYPIFPLISPSEVRRQIQLDIEEKQNELDERGKTGIFPPELGYKDSLLEVYRDFGFQWTLIDDQLMKAHQIDIPDDYIYQVNGLSVFMRSQFLSNNLREPRPETKRLWTGKEFVRHLENEMAGKAKDCYRIIALAGETFGHHIKYYQETFLREMLYALQDSQTVELCLVSELIGKFPPVEKKKEGDFYFPPSSWATDVEDFNRGDYYPHWKSQGNRVHQKLWELTNLLLEASENLSDFEEPRQPLRTLLDEAFYSETYFFASVWFWKPDLIYRGIDVQMRVLYKYFQLTKNRKVFAQGQQIYVELMREIELEKRRQARG